MNKLTTIMNKIIHPTSPSYTPKSVSTLTLGLICRGKAKRSLRQRKSRRLIDKPYSSLTRQLGPPNDNPGEKFITWSIKRMEVAVWFIEVGVDFPLKQNTHPTFIRREFWIFEHRVSQQVAFRHTMISDPDSH